MLTHLRWRQAKVPDSCWHERKALWRTPDIERETRDVGGDAGREGRLAVASLSVGPAMLFSRRWMFAAGIEMQEQPV